MVRLSGARKKSMRAQLADAHQATRDAKNDAFSLKRVNDELHAAIADLQKERDQRSHDAAARVDSDVALLTSIIEQKATLIWALLMMVDSLLDDGDDQLSDSERGFIAAAKKAAASEP